MNVQLHNQLVDKINYLIQKQEYKSALSIAVKLNKKFPDSAQGWYVSSFVFNQNNEIIKAKFALKKAVKLDPKNSEYLYQCMLYLKSINEVGEALTYGLILSKNNGLNVNLLNSLAAFFETNYLFDEAKTLYLKLYEADKSNIDYLAKLAMIEQAQGNIQKAEQLVLEALKLNPVHANIDFFYSHLTKKTESNNNIANLKVKIDKFNGSDINTAMLNFSIAKELEDLKNYKQSFVHRKKGADIYRSTFDYKVSDDTKLLECIKDEFNEDFLLPNEHNLGGKGPVFIVGLPRSGTSLLERVITSHDGIIAGDELTHMSQGILHELKRKHNSNILSDSEVVKASKKINFRRLGEKYLKNTAHVHASTSTFTDKYPQNSYYIGVILKCLPNAKVLIMDRNPVAVCYSVYKQMFHKGSYPFSYDLKEMAQYFVAHNNLMNHWQKIFPKRVMTVSYENLVLDLQSESNKVMKFLGLPWDKKCLEFYKNKQSIASASSTQVRSKLYTDSIESWKHYESELAPLINELKRHGAID